MPAVALRGLAKVERPSDGALLVELGEARAREVDLAADLDQLRASSIVCGIALIVFRFGVTSSPITPSPRVAPRTNSPFS